ncbi:myo-inositol 2-dehydrogenase/D-chiro-inositol 1-dehydrogenase [Aequitasia blattaphilus]|uniref:Gfo/Idh/MocA family oxidoreductase n=1 Tax=Aequitasia blattaphilus TaxID=2949332 RepID=A0ABT1E6F0_9FIRM|nr:Gfo/Idh/MocA family oxidoreductase [Aequitasia blattaphilus]MCP1101416.1 Gfo/Idh/MocA family oxidoreductase [Aequitasia blattaphilus]MCR8614056.1 Gfo/Idh/MocA family oxidoreductase [Aequitasia blattaphilus]
MKKICIGSIGLGRLGYEHAKNIATRIPGAELTALCDVDSVRLAQVAQELGVKNTYEDYEEMCKNPELDGICIVSPSSFHTEHIRIALENGKHVFCEKPLDTTVEKCKQGEAIVSAHPDKVFMLGFMRRYDHSYIKAKEKIDNGDIGRIILIRAYTQDPVATIESTLKFAPNSGGQFLDMCVHDIDLCNWFTGGQKPKNLWAIGGCFAYPQYREWNDGDNVGCMIQYEDETMAFLFAGRAAAQGCNVETEIIGTKGTLRIGSVGTDSMLEVLSENGVCRECYTDFMYRWHEAYISELEEFVNCIIENRQPDVTVYDGTLASQTAYRAKESFETGKMLPFEK